MGYESKLYIVEKHDYTAFDSDKKYASVLAMFDLCKVYDLSRDLRDMPATDCVFYADDGNTQVSEDCYGDKLTECSVGEVIALLGNIIATGEDYWRLFPLLSALTASAPYDKGQIRVLHYGY